MIKVIFIPALLAGCMEQPLSERIQPLDEQQQQAKSAVISVDTDFAATQPDAIVEGIAAADPLRATLGAAAVLALKSKDGDLTAVGTFPAVSLERRLVISSQANPGDVVAALDATANTVKSAELTFDGGAQNNAPMTNAVANGTGISTQVNAAIAAAKPSFSVQSIINKLEDLLAAQDGTTTGVVVVDQVNEKVYLYTCPVANEATLLAVVDDSGIAGFETIATFDVNATPAASLEGEFGE